MGHILLQSGVVQKPLKENVGNVGAECVKYSDRHSLKTLISELVLRRAFRKCILLSLPFVVSELELFQVKFWNLACTPPPPPLIKKGQNLYVLSFILMQSMLHFRIQDHNLLICLQSHKQLLNLRLTRKISVGVLSRRTQLTEHLKIIELGLLALD